MATKKFDVNAGREPKKDFFGVETPTPIQQPTKKEAKIKVIETRTSIYLDQDRRDLIKGYVLWKRANGSPMYRVKDFYSEAVDRMAKENPQVKPYEGDLI